MYLRGPSDSGEVSSLREQLLASPLVPAYRFSTSFLGSTFAITLYQCEMVLYGNEGETDTEVPVRPGGGGVARHVHPLSLPIL